MLSGYRWASIAVVLLLMLPSAASSQEPPPDAHELSEREFRGGRQNKRKELWERSPEELRAEGWDFRGEDRSPGSVSCGLWAIPISTVWHGWGHRCADDNDSHLTLLAMEGVAVGMLSAAVAVAILSNDADTLNPVWSSLFYGGSVLFAGSYFFDILGTFKGSARALNPNRRNTEGITPRALVRWVPTDPFELAYIGGIEVPLRYGFFWFKADAMTDIGDSKFWRVAGDIGSKVWSWDDPSYIGLGVQSRYEAFSKLGFNILTAISYVEFSLDIGQLLGHLHGLHLVNRIGYGFEFYDWEALETDEPFKDRSSVFVLETELSLNILEDLNVAVTYRQRPDLLVGGLSRAGDLFEAIPHPGVGILGVEMGFEPELGWMLEVDVNLGTLVEIWLRFGRHF